MNAKKALALALITGAALSACRKDKAPDADEQVIESVPEVEPNNSPASASVLSEALPLVGAISVDDVDVIRIEHGRALLVTGPSTLRVSAVHTDGRRVELGVAAETGAVFTLPDASWLVELSGAGSWEARHHALEDASGSCGFALGAPSSPVGAAFEALPTAIPFCITQQSGAALVRVPPIRPAGVVAFEVRLDGVGEGLSGTLRVNDGQRTYAETSLEVSRALPALRWPDGVEMFVVLQAHAPTQGSALLRVEPLRAPGAQDAALELEPNDSAVDAVAVSSRSPIAGSLYHLGDVDRFRVDPMVGPVRVELMTATPGAALRVEAGNELTPQNAQRTREGVWEICRLDPSVDLGEIRVALNPDATFGEALNYQLSFKDAAGLGDELPDNADIAVPDGMPWGDFGLAAGEKGILARVEGSLISTDELDQWLLHVPPSVKGSAMQKVAIRVATTSALDLRVRLLDGDKVMIATADRATAGQAETIEMELPEGYYVVEVTGTGAQGCDSLYTLEASVVGAQLGGSGASPGLVEPPSAGGVPGAPAPTPAPRPETGGDDDYPW